MKEMDKDTSGTLSRAEFMYYYFKREQIIRAWKSCQSPEAVSTSVHTCTPYKLYISKLSLGFYNWQRSIN